MSIVEDAFHINGKPTYAGQSWKGTKIEGLLLNSRMVQATFDDLNSDTRETWAYPDTQRWDPDRNTNEFIEAMPTWRASGLLGMTLNLQGGSPQGYSKSQPWHNSAFREDGSIRPEYWERVKKVLMKADELGMVVILGYFYFGQDERILGESEVIRATDNATRALLEGGFRNVLVELNNECNVRYDHAILKPDRIHELILRVKNTVLEGERLAGRNELRWRNDPQRECGESVRLPTPSWERCLRPQSHHRDGEANASGPWLSQDADFVQ